MALLTSFQVNILNLTGSPISFDDIRDTVFDSLTSYPTVPAFGTLVLLPTPSVLTSWEKGRIRQELNAVNISVVGVTGQSLDDAYDNGNLITVDAGPITLGGSGDVLRVQDNLLVKLGTGGDVRMMWDTSFTPDAFRFMASSSGSNDLWTNFQFHQGNLTTTGTTLTPQSVNTGEANYYLKGALYLGGTQGACFNAHIDQDTSPAYARNAAGPFAAFRSDMTTDAADVAGSEYLGFHAATPTDNGGAQTLIGMRVESGFDVGVQVDSGGIELAEISTPSTPTNAGKIYVKDNGGNSELFYLDDSGAESALSPMWISVRRSVDSNTQQNEFNPMGVSYGGSTITTSNSGHITYNGSSGNFTIPVTGTWEVNVSLFLVQDPGGSLDSFRIRDVTTPVDLWTGQAYVHSSVDPVGRAVSAIFDISAGKNIAVLIDSTTTALLTAVEGCTVTIKRIA